MTEHVLKSNDHSEEKIEIDGILDRKALLFRLNNDVELLQELIDFFLQDYHRLIHDIESAIQTKDVQILRIAAHTLKGSLGNFCANKAVGIAYKLETAGINEDFSNVESDLSELKEEMKFVDKALRLLSEEYAA
jgi:HPt (histidine-containing phosphotransfer) domain-containing protein